MESLVSLAASLGKTSTTDVLALAATIDAYGGGRRRDLRRRGAAVVLVDPAVLPALRACGLSVEQLGSRTGCSHVIIVVLVDE